MNQSRAKKIRRKVYGDLSRRDNKYRILERVKKVFVKDEEGNMVTKNKITGQLLCVGLRKSYKEAKKEYYKERRPNV